MNKRAFISCLLAISIWCALSQNSYAQTLVQYDMIDVSIQPCLDSWTNGGASEQSRKACIFATATPMVKYEGALSKYGEHNKFTQHVAYALLRANYYVTESYIALIQPNDVSPA